MTTDTLMPVLFIGHGSPMNALEQNQFTRDWQQLNASTPTPAAIICISAHWLTHGSFITAMAEPPTIHDFGGFPPQLFEQQYSCPGDPELAQRIIDHVTLTAIAPDHQWGLDHGSWVVLKHLYPDASIPVLQLSIDLQQSTEFHYRLAQQLSALREQNILIIGSGNIVHNIQKWISDPSGPFDWARDFNDRVSEAIQANNIEALIHYQHWQPEAADAVPTPEHYLPLIYALGLRREQDTIEFSKFDTDTLESCCMVSLRIGPPC